MLDKDSVLIGLVGGAFGGAVRWYLTVVNGGELKLLPFVFDVLISSVMGFCAFWVANELGYATSICASCAGFAGNVGSRLFEIANKVLNAKVDEIAVHADLIKKGRNNERRNIEDY